ncbi:MAG: ABC transporter substrate-binding protein [Spirochaetaceae bacterium]
MRTCIVSLVVFFVAVSGSLFAAGSSETNMAADDPTSLNGQLTFQHSVEGWHMAYFEPSFEAFASLYPGITVESIEIADGGYEQLAQRVLLGAAARDIPDVAQTGFSFLETLSGSGRAIPLDGFFESDSAYDPDELLPAMRSLGMVGDETYLIPLGVSTPVVYINEAVFEAAGLDPDTPIATWEDVQEASEAMQAAGFFGVYYAWEITGNWIFQTLLENADARMATEQDQIAFDSDEAIEAMQFVQDLVTDGLMPRVSDAVPMFLQGQLGMLISSSAGLETIRSLASFPFRLAPIPTKDGAEPRLPAGGSGVMMFAPEGQERQMAWEFVKFLSSAQVASFVGRNSGYLPANQSVLEELRADFESDADRSLLLEQAPNVVPWHSWPGGRGAEISARINQAEEDIIIGGADVAETLRSAARDVEELLRR